MPLRVRRRTLLQMAAPARARARHRSVPRVAGPRRGLRRAAQLSASPALLRECRGHQNGPALSTGRREGPAAALGTGAAMAHPAKSDQASTPYRSTASACPEPRTRCPQRRSMSGPSSEPGGSTRPSRPLDAGHGGEPRVQRRSPLGQREPRLRALFAGRQQQRDVQSAAAARDWARQAAPLLIASKVVSSECRQE